MLLRRSRFSVAVFLLVLAITLAYTLRSVLTGCQLGVITNVNVSCIRKLSSFTVGALEYAALTPDGRILAVGNAAYEIHLWLISADGYQEIASLVTAPNPLQALAVSRDGHIVAYSLGASIDKPGQKGFSLELWNTQSNQVTTVSNDPDPFAFVLAFSPDGTLLATSDRRNIQLWDIARGQRFGRQIVVPNTATQYPPSDVESLVFSPDGSLLASGGCGGRGAEANCNRGESYLWDISTQQKRIGPLLEHTSAISSLAFTPDGRTLATGSGGDIYFGTPDDYSVVLWDISNGQEKGRSLVSKGGKINALSFGPDGSILAVGSGPGELAPDNVARLWNVTTGQLLVTLDDHNADVVVVAFSPRGPLVAVSSDGTIRLWGIEA